MNWLKRLILRPNKPLPCYVIIYDRTDPHDGLEYEEYYGYFSSPDEARRLWQSYSGPGISASFKNVKLCIVTENWL